MRLLVATIVGAIAVAPAAAYDKQRIEPYCVKLFKKPAERKRCIAAENKAGREVDYFKKTATSGLQKDIVATCAVTMNRSYLVELMCIEKMIGAAERATALGIPAFDTQAYCTRLRHASGGSYAIERQCRKDEAAAYREIDKAASRIAVDTKTYCAKLGEAAGGSYLFMRQCIVDEIGAKIELRQPGIN